jgi:NAD+ kinase
MSSFHQVKSLNDKVLNLNKIEIIYNVEHKIAKNVVEQLEKTLCNYGICSIKEQIIPGKQKHAKNYDKDVDLAIVIGGDGTLLGAARYYAPLGIPLLGINIGRLGFLAQLKPVDIEEGIKKLVEGKFKIEERLMIEAFSKNEKTGFSITALNDFVVKGGLLSRTAQLFLDINGKHVCDYLADGLIISTPTGSTAYTLSAGGPVVMPELDALVIVPVCPHALTTRPLVIPANEEITVSFSTDDDFVYLTADGQENVKIESSDKIYIRQNQHKAKLILLEKENNGFYSILREKLHWGVAPVC